MPGELQAEMRSSPDYISVFYYQGGNFNYAQSYLFVRHAKSCDSGTFLANLWYNKIYRCAPFGVPIVYGFNKVIIWLR